MNRCPGSAAGPAGGRRTPRTLGELALDLLRVVDLDHVALLHVGVVLEDDAALEPGGDLAHVLRSAPERLDRPVVDDRAVADQAGLGAARDAALGDVAAGDRADARGAEDGADLDGPDALLDLLRREHALHGVAELVDRAVDHGVGPDLDALAVRDLAGVADRADVEAEHDRVGGRREHDVGLRDAAHAGEDHLHLDLGLRELGDLVLERLERARHVGLEHQVEVLQQPAPGVLEDRRQGARALGAPGLGLRLQARGALARELAGLAVVLHHAHVLAGLGHGVEAEHLDRLGRRRVLDLAAAVVVQRADAAPVRAGDDRVADPEGAAVDQHGDDRAAARVELGLDHHARRLDVRIGPELLDLGQQQDRLQQVVEVRPRLRGDVDEHGLAAPLLGLEAELRHLRADAVGLRALLVDLVDRDEDRHLGGFRVVDRLARLRLHAVVGRHHDDRDVGDLRAAGAHRRERLMARRVEEGDDLVVGRVDLVGADVLRDAAGLAGGHLGLADGVEQRRLAVVDVAHDGHDGGARLEVLVVVLERRLRVLLVRDVDDLDLLVELVREHLDGVVGQRLGQRGHLAQLHQLLDDVGDRDAQVLRDVLDRRAGVDLDDAGLQDADVLGHRLGVGAAPAPAAAPRRAPLGAAAGPAARAAAGPAARASALAPRGLRVDDDAPHAAGRAGSALALERGARGTARAVVAAVAVAVAGARAVAAGRRLGLRLGLRLHALGRACAEGADAEIAGRAQLLARGRLGLGAVRGDLLAGQRGVGQALVHRRSRRLHRDARGVQLLHDLRSGHVVLLG